MMNNKLHAMVMVVATTCVLSATSAASAVTVWTQGFESDVAGWFDDDDDPGFGNIEQVLSGGGTLGLPSAAGNAHAEVQQAGPVGDESGPYNQFDGYRNVWPEGMTASIDVYLDTSWAAGEGFNYSVAANGTDGNHQRDFIFHVTQDTSTGDLLVGGSNNTNFDPDENLETVNNVAVSTSAWYTFEHVFYDAGDGSLAVDMNLRDDGGALLFTETRNNVSDDLASVVGGNRYAWFTNVDIAGGIAVDNHSLSVVVPEPASFALLAMAGSVACLWRRRSR